MKIISIILSLFVSLFWALVTSQVCYSKTTKIYRNMFIGRHFGNHDQTVLNNQVKNSPSQFQQKEKELYQQHISSIKNIWKKHQFLMETAKSKNMHVPAMKQVNLDQEIQRKVNDALESHQTGDRSHEELLETFLHTIKKSNFPTHGLNDDQVYQRITHNLEQTIKENFRDHHIYALEKALFGDFDPIINSSQINTERKMIQGLMKKTRFSAREFEAFKKNDHIFKLIKKVTSTPIKINDVNQTQSKEIKDILQQGYLQASVRYFKLCQNVTNASSKLSQLMKAHNIENTEKRILASIYRCNLNQEHHFLSLLNIENIIRSKTQNDLVDWTKNLKNVFNRHAPNFMAALEMRIQLLKTNIRSHHKFSIKIVEWKNVPEIKLHQVASKVAAEKLFNEKRKKTYQRHRIN